MKRTALHMLQFYALVQAESMALGLAAGDTARGKALSTGTYLFLVACQVFQFAVGDLTERGGDG